MSVNISGSVSVPLEGNFTKWTLLYNVGIPTGGQVYYGHRALVTPDGMIFLWTGYEIVLLAKIDGTVLVVAQYDRFSGAGIAGIAQMTVLGKYMVVNNLNSGAFEVWSNGTLLATVDTFSNISSNFGTAQSNLGIAISPEGKYIIIWGQDRTDFTKARVLVYQGS